MGANQSLGDAVVRESISLHQHFAFAGINGLDDGCDGIGWRGEIHPQHLNRHVWVIGLRSDWGSDHPEQPN